MSERRHRYRDDKDDRRSRSPDRRHKHSSHRERSPRRSHHRHKASPKEIQNLPLNARPLTKHDFEAFKPMFALYLDIQKRKILEDMDETEAKGRWKSFMGKWNRGELAEGWYDPSTLQKAIDAESNPEPAREKEPTPRNEDDSDDDDELGPAPPGQQHKSRQQRLGPSIPNLQDLELKRELDAEDSNARREDLRYERKLDRKEQKERLDELVPRAEAGTRERKLEKKAEVNAKMKSFREKSPGAAVEVPESELMGGGDGLAEFKKQKDEFERKKNDREIRREELLRARAEEREERLREYREKEDKTMAMLQEIAKQRFG